jgi:hypothetical protein
MQRFPGIGMTGAVFVAAVLGGCGGSHRTADPPPAAPPPVAEQVHDALMNALREPAAPLAAQRTRLPYRAVAGCTGPSAGGAGRYRCRTTPRGPHGLRELAVDVRADGTWATAPVPGSSMFRGHRRPAVSSIWGTGIRVPH